MVTDKQVWNQLRLNGCCWVGGHGCQCYSRQLAMCFKEEKERMELPVYTDDNHPEPSNEAEKAFEAFMKYCETGE